MTDVGFLAFLVVDGALAGAIYALVGLAFVVVYKACRIANFAVGEFVMLASRVVAAGLQTLGLGLAGGLGFGCVGMVAAALAFNRVILRPLAGQPMMSLIMVTIGLGAFMRGAAAIVFAGIPSRMTSTMSLDPVFLGDVPVSADKLIAAAVAVTCVTAVSWFFRGSRTGLALRAIASNPQQAQGAGIDLHRHFAIAWAMVGILSVLAGTLWTLASGGGFGLQLLGLKVFPIVIVGGLDSIGGTVVGAFFVGILESLAAGYIDPVVGSAFSQVAAYLVLVAVLFVRPYGLFGRPDIERI
ncbi:MAG: branched-chain amino acid ABC transporter permease [Candidatus Rokuibacteriota bacterium]|nr:MAG: branched-chain amino acid ABC transporter permease [Candidatus Rokubacteria bacterium]